MCQFRSAIDFRSLIRSTVDFCGLILSAVGFCELILLLDSSVASISSGVTSAVAFCDRFLSFIRFTRSWSFSVWYGLSEIILNFG